jgi:CMP-N-acetylneuraminic acid synthetase
MRDVIALLPMKANSERLPGKNFRSFAGKPLFRWMLDTLLELDDIARVIINTDARDILLADRVGLSDRVEIRDRREDIRGDLVSMNLIIADDVANTPGETYLMTHTTNPLLSAATIRRALGEFRKASKAGTHDSLMSVNRVQTRFYRADGSPINHDPRHLVRTQDLEPWFEENSNLYIFTRESFAATQSRVGLQPRLFETPRLESIDIDTTMDWEMALVAARCLSEQRNGASS